MNSTKTINELKEILGHNAEFFWAYTTSMVKRISSIDPDFFTKHAKDCMNSEIIGFTSKEMLAHLKDNQEMLKHYAYTFLLYYVNKEDDIRRNTLFQFFFGKDLKGNPCEKYMFSIDTLLKHR